MITASDDLWNPSPNIHRDINEFISTWTQEATELGVTITTTTKCQVCPKEYSKATSHLMLNVHLANASAPQSTQVLVDNIFSTPELLKEHICTSC
eukprot:Awhi_evm1s12871